MTNEDRFISGNQERFEKILKEFIEIPSVSADPSRKPDIFRMADAAETLLREAGAKVERVRTSGSPVICGSFQTKAARQSVTLYNHLDVQPADEPEWNTDPFVFQKQGEKYCGRGSTDDKGPAVTALLAAQYAFEIGIPINIQFIWELEEEIGSPHFAEFLSTKAGKMKTDSVLVIDSVWISAGTPCLYYALRGNITGSMILRTAGRAVHSGITGGVACNPLFELSRVVSQSYDPATGKVLIPGFYDGVLEPTAEEYRHFRKSGFRLRQWSASYELKKIQVQSSVEALKRLWCLPTFEVHGMVGGYTGPGVKTAIPPVAELKFSCRLAPGQDPKQIAARIESHVKRIHADVEVVFHSMLRPFLGSFTGPYAQVASDAFFHGFGKRPVFARAGGSDGAVVLLYEHLKAPINLMGLSLPEHGYHAPNEYFDWRQAVGGFKSLVKYFQQASLMGKS